MTRKLILYLLVIVVPVSITGCGNSSSTGPAPARKTSILRIAGHPSQYTKVGENYFFRPSASVSAGLEPSFVVFNQPPWMSFDPATGALSGTPADTDIGRYEAISITVSDGQRAAQLAPFSIEVLLTGTGSVTLVWAAPFEYEDGTPLTDLAGYVIRYGTQSGSHPNSAFIDNPGITSYVVEELTPGPHFFVLSSYNTQGVESVLSNELSVNVE